MRLSFLFFLFSVSFLSLHAVQVWNIVPTMSADEIQQKINNAGPEDILLFGKGTYTLNKSLTSGKSIIFQGESSTASDVNLLVNGNFRHVVASKGKMKLHNLSFRGTDHREISGGIEYQAEDSLVVMNCEFYSNSHKEGGAISATGNLWVVNSVFTDNQAISKGGAIYNKGKAFLSGCFFSQNKAKEQGGAIYNQSRYRTRIEPTTLNYCTFSQNTASAGGAVYTENALVVEESLFAENKAEHNNGGALFSLQTSRLISSVFHRNHVVGHGGVLASEKNIHIRQSTFNENSSDNTGGAIYVQPTDPGNTEETNVVYSSVFTGNRSQSGGGMYTSLSTFFTDCRFENNQATASGGGIYGENGILLERTFFENNTAASEGGGVDGSIVKVINTTMIRNSAQHGSAIHAQKDAAIVFSTFTDNKVTLKSGGVIYGNNVFIYGNIISGNLGQDKISGKIKANEYNLIGKSDLQEIFLETDANNMPVLKKEKGILPALLLKTGGEADNKIPAGQALKWEKELGMTEFFNKDQLGNSRSFDVSSDIGAVMSDANFIPGQIPIPAIEVETMLTDINERKLQVVDNPFELATILTEKDPDPILIQHEETFSSVSSFDEDLDKIIDAIFSDEELLADHTEIDTEAEIPYIATDKVFLTDFFIPISGTNPLGGTYTINSSNPQEDRDFKSLEEAINALNSKGNSQEVRFIISPGTYIMKRQVTISHASFPIFLQGEENEAEPVILRAGGNNRVLVVAINIPVKIERIIFEGPDGATEGKNVKNGGGISCNTNAVLTFEKCIFRYNKNQTGGGIFAKNVYISQCSFYNNGASDGSGVYATECTAVNSTFYGNKAGVGAGIYAKDRALAVLCTFTQNEATGKDAAVFSPSLHLYGCILTANKSRNEFEEYLESNFSNIFENVQPFNVFADVDDKGIVKLDKDGPMPVVQIKPGGVAAEQISESLLFQWEDELKIKGLLIDQEGKPRPQNRKAETGAWEIPDKRGIH
ncbi:MAG: right-handed parallel beta-helix repeat-containing protein [Candidatus Azobacteroides sp.]|nr:right-handed parallel beta-helix repeat-containing protein [Candidatus Azobacteroides sp.]